MGINIPLDALTLHYSCDEHLDPILAEQPLADITEVGTLICPECGEDMGLVGTTVTGEPRETRTIDGEEVEALSPKYGKVVLVAEVLAVSFGTHYACFKPGDPGAWGTPIIELKRQVSGVEVLR